MNFPTIINRIDEQKDVVVIVLAASRLDGETRLPLTDGQKDAAMQAAKATLQLVGADVAESSTALLIPAQPGAARLTVDCRVEPIETADGDGGEQ